MRGLGILVLVILFFWLVWPVISRWLKRKAMERAEDYMRASMGLPPREKKKRKEKVSKESPRNEYFYQRQRRNPFQSSQRGDEPLIPKEYAEDVEFVETKDYSSTETRTRSQKRETYHESQISDAEFTEIKNPRT